MIADNLAAHAIGGFFQNLSRIKRFCRFCMAERISSTDIKIRSALRTKEMFKNHIENISIDPSLSSTYGIACDSCLNSLKYFHVIDGLPPDFAHDVLEGFPKDLTVDSIVYLMDKKYISLLELNKAIVIYPYFDVDKKNKPQVIQDRPASQLKMKQTAIEMWHFCVFYPFLLEKKYLWMISVGKFLFYFVTL
ncbi:uncharacterized protein LOC130648238 [Hydractinia symbiolongicarpus]|uniref:uncharacterized protein LOC130648238 n=1 Tax=Hydractinia symbiolongicarpus TaxID=13093 RepID=UPI0025506800|nr:uncharacterized protein LOC130648238 [Hydractinia symbiolongicarpus]